ncbi:MAG: type II toxin-antitoxin system YoeB family toxin [Mogibacterium sp.]|nr:type II toxin-antitoxin system YoeB family toxin [Mogibacterium sp.]
MSGNLAGFWSVRIDEKNRIVFRIENDSLEIAECGSHYTRLQSQHHGEASRGARTQEGQ